MCIADAHYGADWTIAGLQGEVLNRYNPEVFEERMADLLLEVTGIIETHGIRRVHL